jgi:hypothetical protein
METRLESVASFIFSDGRSAGLSVSNSEDCEGVVGLMA